MEIATVTTTPDNTLLPSVREALDRAESAILCVAFVQSQGVHLLQPQLARLGAASRLLVTTVFQDGAAALKMAFDLKTQVKTLNPASGTYHPKLYIGRRGDDVTVILGSANLTGGLVNNVEAAVVMRGRTDDEPIQKAWQWAESLWTGTRAQNWSPTGAAAEDAGEKFDPVLLALVKDAVERNKRTFMTLGSSPRPNRIMDVTASGIYVETDSSKEKGTPPQLIPAWMFSLAWDYLRTHGTLTNSYLLSTDGLNVKRSSGVCAILAKLQGVRVKVGGQIELTWSEGPAPTRVG